LANTMDYKVLLIKKIKKTENRKQNKKNKTIDYKVLGHQS